MRTLQHLTFEGRHVGRFLDRRHHVSEPIFIPKIVSRPKSRMQTWKFAIFGGMHGDEEAGVLACQELVRWSSRQPEELRDFELHIYPICNPIGVRNRTRHSGTGQDLNRHFWVGSAEPEVIYLEGELRREAYDGIISLHTDDTAIGVYGFVSGALLSGQVLDPALEAAGRIIPRNPSPYVDGFLAERGIIKEGYPGVLGAPPEQHPRPMEIVFEVPDCARMAHQVEASVIATKTILAEYLKLQSFAANL